MTGERLCTRPNCGQPATIVLKPNGCKGVVALYSCDVDLAWTVELIRDEMPSRVIDLQLLAVR